MRLSRTAQLATSTPFICSLITAFGWSVWKGQRSGAHMWRSRSSQPGSTPGRSRRRAQLLSAARGDWTTTAPRERGTPQGSPISPLLANLFMHYAFDKWTDREHPGCPFERYADDVVIHCDTEQQAQQLCADLVERLGSLGLELHPDKTKNLYCKDTNRRDEAQHTSFDFLGYTFRGRLARGRRGFFVSFSPAMSPNAKKAIGKQISHWHLNRRSATDLAGLARAINARIRGWFNYYGAFYRSELYAIAARIDEHLVRWAMQKFKRLRGQPTKAWRWLDAARQREPQLFAHWHLLASTQRRTAGAV